jgi:hypothetical protein
MTGSYTSFTRTTQQKAAKNVKGSSQRNDVQVSKVVFKQDGCADLSGRKRERFMLATWAEFSEHIITFALKISCN